MFAYLTQLGMVCLLQLPRIELRSLLSLQKPLRTLRQRLRYGIAFCVYVVGALVLV